jgi:hypothetical protein
VRRVLLPAVLAALLAVSLGCKLDMSYDKYAVVFGVADYTPLDAGGGDLSYTDDDAVDMAALLAADGFAVRGWASGAPASGATLDGEATAANFLSVLAGVAAEAGEDDLFLFYFSGHGGQTVVNASEGASADDPADEYIYFDSDPLEPFTEEDLRAALQAIPCLKKIVIIDACNSGGFIGDSGDVDGVPSDYWGAVDGPLAQLGSAVSLYFGGFDGSADIIPGEAIVLAAAGEQEFSWETDSLQHGVFTYYLLQAPGAADRNHDGYVTVTEAYGYVRRKIDENFNSAAYFDERFTPHVSGGPLDYVLFTSR